jgi:hypothetical protein
VEDDEFPRRLVSEDIAWDISFLFEDDEVSGRSSGRRIANLEGGGATEDSGGLNLIIIAFPVRSVELNLEGSFFGLLATFFPSK